MPAFALAPAASRLAARASGLEGAGRQRLLGLLFAVYAVDWADRTSVGAVAPSLKQRFEIGNTSIGLLATAFTIVGAAATLPAGVLADRVRRTRLLSVALVIWAMAMLATGAAPSFRLLLAARCLLGVVVAVAGPTVPSLVGDLAGPRDRARAMAFVDSGQVVGIGVGYVIAGFAIAVLSWRWAFWLLGLPAVVAAVLLWRKEDPPRGGAEHHEDAETGAEAGPHVEPDPALVLDDPEGLSIWEAARYVLRVRTNVVVVLAGSVGQFFFAGLSTFAVVYVTGQYRISTAQADLGLPVLGAGALAGMFGGAWLGDRLQRRGQPDARLIVGGVSFFVATGFALPAILTHSLLVAVPAIVAGTAALNAATPTLDAVRLSVIVPPLRGRAEAVRTVVRTGAEGFAPLAFGLLADSLAGGGHSGLRLAFLITLPAVAANGLLTLLARRWYQREVASARASGTQPAP